MTLKKEKEQKTTHNVKTALSKNGRQKSDVKKRRSKGNSQTTTRI
jgi:hypothetical protein